MLKALSGLKDSERHMAQEVQKLVTENQGFLLENIPQHIKPEIVQMMEGLDY